jgi:hypothetical protein
MRTQGTTSTQRPAPSVSTEHCIVIPQYIIHQQSTKQPPRMGGRTGASRQGSGTDRTNPTDTGQLTGGASYICGHAQPSSQGQCSMATCIISASKLESKHLRPCLTRFSGSLNSRAYSGGHQLTTSFNVVCETSSQPSC